MPEFQSLRGRNALSDFRLRKLLHSLQSAAPAIIGLTAEYRHFIELEQSPSGKQQRILERVLTYGPSGDASVDDAVDRGGQLLLVVPRLGTISAWASKATDIAHSCGLTGVRRIERGIAWHAFYRATGTLSPADRDTLSSLIHDRMTETVLDSEDAARELFHHYQPEPLKTVSVIRS